MGKKPSLRTILLSCFVLSAGSSWAGEKPDDEEAKAPPGQTSAQNKGADKEFTKAQNVFPLAEEVSGSNLIKKQNEYLKSRKWSLGFSISNPNKAYIGWGEAPIRANADDVKFGQSRSFAYETALSQALGKFVEFQQRTTSTETISKIFQDGGEISEDDAAEEANRLKVIWRKIVALTDAKLDKALEEAGIDATQFKVQPLQRKQKLLQDSISRQIKVRAMQSVAGVRVLATFADLKGVGVLIVYSENHKEIAQGVLLGRTVAHSTGANQKDDILKQIEAVCANGDKDLADTFGVRVMTDENGDRVLVSFGQWSPAVTRADSRFKQDAAIQGARKTSKDLADGALTDFVRSTLSLESDNSIWQNAELNRVITAQSMDETESLKIGQTLRATLRQTGTTTIQGVTTIKEWTVNHPETGHLLVGTVLMWSPSSRDAAIHGLKSPKTNQPKAGSARDFQNKIRVSPDFDKDADF